MPEDDRTIQSTYEEYSAGEVTHEELPNPTKGLGLFRSVWVAAELFIVLGLASLVFGLLKLFIWFMDLNQSIARSLRGDRDA